MLAVGKKTITTLQEGSVYSERWTAEPGDPNPDGCTAQCEFMDTQGQVLLTIDGEVSTWYTQFEEQPDTMAVVPNGAGFRVFVIDGVGPHCIRYGTVFRREPFFPNAPNYVPSFQPRRYTDNFTRPNGQVGGSWVQLYPMAFIQGSPELPTVGTAVVPFGFNQYSMRYISPFTSDSVEFSISLTDKGTAGASWSALMLAMNSTGSNCMFVKFNSDDTVELATGNALAAAQADPYDLLSIKATETLAVPSSPTLGNYKVRYDSLAKTLGLYTPAYEEIALWEDTEDEAPHGGGFRYFGLSGKITAMNSGIQVGYITGADAV